MPLARGTANDPIVQIGGTRRPHLKLGWGKPRLRDDTRLPGERDTTGTWQSHPLTHHHNGGHMNPTKVVHRIYRMGRGMHRGLRSRRRSPMDSLGSALSPLVWGGVVRHMFGCLETFVLIEIGHWPLLSLSRILPSLGMVVLLMSSAEKNHKNSVIYTTLYDNYTLRGKNR